MSGCPVASSPQRRPPLDAVVAVGIGGILGTLARYRIGQVWPAAPGRFPWATLSINVSGALVLGVIATLVVERWPSTRYVRPFACVGVCGGYTTWSTFMTETAVLGGDGHVGLAAAYLAVTVVAGLAAVLCGIRLGRLWPTRG